MPVLLFRRLFGILGAEEHGHIASLKLGVLGDRGDLAAIGAELRKKFLSERRMRHFTATETYSVFDSVAIVQELASSFALGIEVVGIDAGGHADLLDLASFSFFSCSKRNLP